MIINVHQDQARAEIEQAMAELAAKFPSGLLVIGVPERRIAMAKMWGDDAARFALVHCLATDHALLEMLSRACLQAHMIRDDAQKRKAKEGGITK